MAPQLHHWSWLMGGGQRMGISGVRIGASGFDKMISKNKCNLLCQYANHHFAIDALITDHISMWCSALWSDMLCAIV